MTRIFNTLTVTQYIPSAGAALGTSTFAGTSATRDRISVLAAKDAG